MIFKTYERANPGKPLNCTGEVKEFIESAHRVVEVNEWNEFKRKETIVKDGF